MMTGKGKNHSPISSTGYQGNHAAHNGRGMKTIYILTCLKCESTCCSSGACLVRSYEEQGHCILISEHTEVNGDPNKDCLDPS